jgi:hypothetical protein
MLNVMMNGLFVLHTYTTENISWEKQVTLMDVRSTLTLDNPRYASLQTLTLSLSSLARP